MLEIEKIPRHVLEYAYNKITETGCEIVSFAYRWVKGEETFKVTDDCIEEGLYLEDDIKKHIFPKLLMDKNIFTKIVTLNFLKKIIFLSTSCTEKSLQRNS